MNKLINSAVSVLALLLVAGCEKKTDPAPTTTAVDSPSPAVAPATPTADKPVTAATSLDMSKIPVEEQYEKEVEAEVTAANFEAQLEALEKEIKVE